MACNFYSNGANPKVVFGMGTLPGGFCPADFQALFNAIPTYLQGTLPATFSTFLIKDTEPEATDRDKLWVKVDPNNCNPIGFYLFSTNYGVWLPLANQVWNATAGGTANALTATFSPTLKYLSEGHLFIVKAGAASNTGAVTLTPLGMSSFNVTKQGGKPLTGGEIAPNALLLFTYRDNPSFAFELLNPLPAQADVPPTDRLVNGSFEVDTDGDGIPDGWTYTGLAAGAVSASVVGHGAKSFSINGASNHTGTLAMTTLQPCKGNDFYTDGEMMVLRFWHYTSSAANDDTITVEWYDKDGVSLAAASTIWSWNVANTSMAAHWAQFFAAMVPHSGARFFRLRLIGNTAGGGTGISYFDGLGVETVTFKRKCNFFYLGSAAQAERAWKCPTGVTMIRVTAIGGGGAGGTDNPGGSDGGGGGAGGMVVSLVPVVPGTSYKIKVGAGGAAAGGNGSNTSFDDAGVNVVAYGGGGGTQEVHGNGGSGIVGTGCLGWVFPGGDGIDGPYYTDHGWPGSNGGNGAGAGASGTASVSLAGGLYGGGGCGKTHVGGIAASDGGHGMLSIEY